MKHLFPYTLLFAALWLMEACSPGTAGTTHPCIPKTYTISKDSLLDKIKGGWAGQTIGCTYGGPTEFKYCGTMIQDYVPIEWYDGYIKWWYDNVPGLYDDVYMDLTFVDVFDRLGLDAPADSFATAFATAEYPLWHANQAARYNILQGIMPPASGHWMNNPHACDLDYQIEADYAGLMSPGMPNAASGIADQIGHIMTYGDGWYGGVYVGAMYSLAFLSDDIGFIVKEALKTIPQESQFYQCMSDVIRWHQQYPDVYKTMDISTRCGQDSDCNPASAAGILGTILGYNRIPDQWKRSLKEVEDRNFAYTDISLNKAYQLSFGQALQMIEKNGGTVEGDLVTIQCQQPVAVRYEKAFEGMYPTGKRGINKKITDIQELEFNGNGVVIRGNVNASDEEYVAEVELYIDGQPAETAQLPASFAKRRYELFWKYRLAEGKHTVAFKWLNPQQGVSILISEMLVYCARK